MKGDYKDKFNIQKYHAHNRGIEWQLTFEEWLSWWGDDIVNRGRKSGQLVMGRIGDKGPYALSNIKKITVNDNHKEADSKCLGKVHTVETRDKMRKSHLGRVMSEETKNKIRNSQLKRLAKSNQTC